MSDDIADDKANLSEGVTISDGPKEATLPPVRRKKRPAIAAKKAAMLKGKKRNPTELRAGAAELRLANKETPEIVEKMRKRAEGFNERLRPIVTQIIEGGVTSPRQISLALNKRQILTAKNTKWQLTTVQNLLNKLGIKPGKISP